MQRKAKYICTVIWEDADGNPDLDNIEDDDEYEIVAMLSMSCWMTRSLMRSLGKTRSESKRRGRIR